MTLIKLGTKGQISIPQGVLRQLAIGVDAPLLVETTADGAILLRPVSVHPVEMYSDERVAEFARENALTPAQSRAFAPQLADFDGWLRAQAGAAPGARRVAEPRAPEYGAGARAGRAADTPPKSSGPRPAASRRRAKP